MQLRGSLFQKFLARGRESHPCANYNMTIYPKPMNVKVGGYNLSKPIYHGMEHFIGHWNRKLKTNIINKAIKILSKLIKFIMQLYQLIETAKVAKNGLKTHLWGSIFNISFISPPSPLESFVRPWTNTSPVLAMRRKGNNKYIYIFFTPNYVPFLNQ